MSGDLACTYAALILSDDGQEVTADKMDALIKGAGVSVEPYWAMLFAKFLATKSVDELVANVGAGACPFPRQSEECPRRAHDKTGATCGRQTRMAHITGRCSLV
jgi:ribosomal protein L12E/L44/L45/RPP1/RPP2